MSTDLKTLLNINDKPFCEDWILKYGLTEDRKKALVEGPKDASGKKSKIPKDSLFKPNSETALTLFMLGNLDGWKQLQPNRPYPRQNGDSWDPDFFFSFNLVTQDKVDDPPRPDQLWEKLFGKLNWSKSTLLFEFEVMNSAFNNYKEGGVFKDLSFLNLKANDCWSAFDAFMIVPSETPGLKGTLIGFEAKLGSDISLGTKDFLYVNQIMRNLETGYWLTHHEHSQWKGWNFEYVFICPENDFKMKANYYSWMLADEASKKQALNCYKKVLELHYKEKENAKSASFLEENFDKFSSWALKHLTVIHWACLGNLFEKDFFTKYLNKFTTDVKKSLRDRFIRAGIICDNESDPKKTE